MALLRVYEIHTYKQGAWKIDSVFDERDLALMEADRIERGGRYSAIRVVEETFDDVTQKGNTRTIYRSTKADKANAEMRQQRSSRIAAPPPPPPRMPVHTKKSITRQVLLATFAFTAIVGVGLALLYFLNTLSAGR